MHTYCCTAYDIKFLSFCIPIGLDLSCLFSTVFIQLGSSTAYVVSLVWRIVTQTFKGAGTGPAHGLRGKDVLYRLKKQQNPD